jgi:MFS family permease
VKTIIALGIAQTLSWGSTYYLPAILAGHMAADTGTSTALVFAAFSCALLATAVLSPIAGRLIDRHGGRRVLAASNLVLAAGLAFLGSSSGAGTLFAAWLVLGIGMSAGLYEAAFSTLAGIFGHEARRPITGITLIAGFASTVCWPISAWMDAELGWRAACFVWAGVQLAVALPLNLSLPPARRHPAPPKHEAAAHPPRRRLGIMIGLAAVFSCAWFCSTAMAAHLPRLLQDAGASLTAAVAAAALVGPAQVAARVMEFWLMRHAHPVVSARIAALAHPVGAAGLAALGAPAAAFFTLAHGAGNGVMTIVNGTLPLRYFGPGGYGLRQGLLMAPARLLQALAPFAFDVLLGRFGLGALVVTSALGVCSFAILSLLPGEAGKPAGLSASGPAG